MNRITTIGLIVFFSIALFSCSGNKTDEKSQSVKDLEKNTTEELTTNDNSPLTAAMDGKVQHITTAQFANFVTDYKSGSKYLLKSELPCVVDFYADWCKPCKIIAPYLDELAIEFKGKVNILKINIDEQPEIADFYKIQAIPTMMFCPKKGDFSMEVGGSDKTTIKSNIEKYLLHN